MLFHGMKSLGLLPPLSIYLSPNGLTIVSQRSKKPMIETLEKTDIWLRVVIPTPKKSEAQGFLQVWDQPTNQTLSHKKEKETSEELVSQKIKQGQLAVTKATCRWTQVNKGDSCVIVKAQQACWVRSSSLFER